MKILVAGFQHETNTFAPTRADYQSFLRGEGRPALSRGDEILALAGVNIPIGGFIEQARALGHTVVPLLWAAASPSAHVTEDAYERIAGDILAGIDRLDFDAIYLDLHGAMVAGHLDDGEGELLRRIRAAVGADVAIVASLDLHANVTPLMVSSATAMVAFRTYPHVDMAATGARAARLLDEISRSGTRLATAMRCLPYLIPINAMCTLVPPAREIMALLESSAGDGVSSVEFTPGFPAADVPGCGPALWAHGSDAQRVQRVVDDLCQHLLAMEAQWHVDFLAPAEAVRAALAAAEQAPGRPILIADTQDNPGAGSDANSMVLLRELLAQEVQGACVGLVWDPSAVQAAHVAGIGAEISLVLGAQVQVQGGAPLRGKFRVAHLSGGRCMLRGPMMHGAAIDMGPTATLRIGGVSVVLTSKKVQLYDREMLRCAGVQPERVKVLVLKSSVHFLADFGPMAGAVLVAKAPGSFRADPVDLPWSRLRQGMRIGPCGPAFKTPAIADNKEPST